MTDAPLSLFATADPPPAAAPHPQAPPIDYTDPSTWPTGPTDAGVELVVVVPSRTGHLRQWLTPGGTDPWEALAPMLGDDVVGWCRLPRDRWS